MNLKQYPIRKLKEKDIPVLSKLARRLYLETYGHIIIGKFEKENFQKYLDKAFTEVKLSNEIATENVVYFGIFESEKLIAYAKINSHDKQSLNKPIEFLEIQRFYLEPSYQRIGLGRFFFNFLTNWASKNQFKTIWLRTWEENKKALFFYEKMGLKIIGTTVYKFEEAEDLDYVLEKDLQ